MADDTEIGDCVTNNLTEAVTEQSSKLLDNNLEFKNSSENNDGTASTPSSAHSQGETSNRASPDPSCSICLGKLQNKSFTDSCYHPFCFACLLKWSKVKAVCPLCKVEFKSIVHNVRSNSDYDQYYVGRAPSAHPTWSTSDSMGFRYTTTTMSVRQRECPLAVSFFRCEQHRHTYAPHSVRVNPLYTVNREQSPSQQEPRNIQFRRRVYNENLWAKHTSQRVRRATPSYYYANQACTHRLVPWLTRELIVLMSGNEQRVAFILDLIMSLILRHNILSEDFFLHIQPYFDTFTKHFVHEFYSYAISIHDMDRYDELVQYEQRNESSSASSAESGSDVIAIDSGSDEGEYPVPVDISIRPTLLSPHISPYSSHRSLLEKYKKNREKPLTKLFLKKNRDNNLWNVLFPPPMSPISSTSSLPEDFSQPSSSMAGVESMPSTSRVGSTRRSKISIYPVVTLSSGGEENEYVDVCDNDEDDDECVILQELKPRCLRTPEVLELSSDSERAVSPTLPGLEPVSDGSFDTVEEGFAETAPSFPDNSSPIVINVPDSSQTPLQDESPYIPPYLSYIERPYERRVARKPKRPERSLYPLRIPSSELRWSSSSSSRSKERHSRSWSRERDLSIQDFFNKKFSHNRGLLPFSESLEFGESSHSVQMPDTNTLSSRDHYSSSKSPSLKKLKVRSIVKRSTHRSLSNSSNNSTSNKKHKSKKRKRKKGEKHKHRKH